MLFRSVGDSEAAVRLLSVGASVAAIAMLYALASRLFGQRTGKWAALLAAVMPFQVEFAQEARMYALLSLLSVASLYAFVSLIERGRLRSFIAYAVVTALMLYTHAHAVFVFSAEVLMLLVVVGVGAPELRRFAKRCALAEAVAVLLFLPWLPIVLRQVFQVQRTFWIPEPTSGGLVDALVLYGGSAPLAWILCGLAVIGVGVGLRASTRPRSQPDLTLPVMAFWLLCPTVLPLVISHVSAPIFLPKYTIAGSLAFMTLAARGIALAPQRIMRVGIGVIVICGLWTPYQDYYETAHKVNWRDSVARLDHAASPGDVVFFNQPYATIPFEYYSHRRDIVIIPFLKDHDVLTGRSLRDLVNFNARGHDRVWVVLSNPDDLSSLIINELRQRRVAALHTVESGIDIYLFTTAVAQPPPGQPTRVARQ